ncbi:g3976 [Coccomyxa viridis]|uniref:6-phosphogluconate dehydrogenase, decarboxylating n=1 Tax=Coccomyxa viridis TaxID=1274662 RepID=A0ABP1FU56_9CHLO
MPPQPQKKKAGTKKGKKDKDAAGGATVPAALANLKKRGLFSKDLPNMMYGYGDTKTHYQATVDLVEDIAVEYATALAQSALDRTSTGKGGKLQAEDVLFVVRKDPKKFARGMQLLQMNEEIKTAKKAFEETEQLKDADEPANRSARRAQRIFAIAAPEAPTEEKQSGGVVMAEIGLIGLAVMGQNFALNVAEHGFKISVYNRSYEKTEAAVKRANKEGLGDNLHGYKDLKEFVGSLKKPRRVMFLVKAGSPVDATIESLRPLLEKGDIMIDGGNEWYENTEMRAKKLEDIGIMYMGMGVSGGEEGARNGPSLMPGGTPEAYQHIEPIVQAVAAQVNDGPCVTYVGPGGAGNFVKMVHNGIEYGDMQLISEAYDVLRTVGGLSNEEMVEAFNEWNATELDSFLIEISALILAFKDEDGQPLVNKILDKTGMKGTGKWTVQQAAELSVPAPTIEAALDGRFLSGLKDQRVKAAKLFQKLGATEPKPEPGVDKAALVKEVKQALYASKICSYAQGLNIIKAKSAEKSWDVDIGSMARIWKGGCIIRAVFLDDIYQAYKRNPALENLMMDEEFGSKLVNSEKAWRSVVIKAINAGLAVPGFSTSLAYYDTYRRENVPANLIQAQRDFFGSHTYERTDKPGQAFHTVWDPRNSADSITSLAYNT